MVIRLSRKGMLTMTGVERKKKRREREKENNETRDGRKRIRRINQVESSNGT